MVESRLRASSAETGFPKPNGFCGACASTATNSMLNGDNMAIHLH